MLDLAVKVRDLRNVNANVAGLGSSALTNDMLNAKTSITFLGVFTFIIPSFQRDDDVFNFSWKRGEQSCGEGQTEGATWSPTLQQGAHSALGARGPWRRDCSRG